ncbi:MAG: NAD(P)-dependent oxidoreductase, partial [Planctomycetota bacterium]
MDPQQAVPIVLNGPGLRVLIVGGGAVGARRATSLVEAGATVRVVTIQQRATLPAEASVELRPFEPNDVDGANLVVAATDDPAANASVGDAAKQRNVLCCRADVSELGEVLFARKVTAGPMVAGVVSGSPTMSGRAVEAVRQTLEPLAEFARAQSSIRSLVKASP